MVICGRNIDQNELIVKKYLTKNDIYVHSDVYGSASCVIKNSIGDVPPSTIEQAGRFVICNSKAWANKVPDYAWWVYPHQVSKTAESGEYLTKGSFMIRGQKNFIKGIKLELGLTVLFKEKLPFLITKLFERSSLFAYVMNSHLFFFKIIFLLEILDICFSVLNL